LMYLGAISSFILYGVAFNDPRCVVYGLLLLILTACESAIGLGMIVVLFRLSRTLEYNSYQTLGG
jgi:NADH:ubiquinone oxidoreductase subunit K